MCLKVLTATWKSQLRSILFWTCLCAALLFFVDDFHDVQLVGTYSFHKHLANFAAAPLARAVPVFLAVTVSVDALKDRNNHFFDVQKCTSLPLRSYYIGKIFAHISSGMLLAFVYTYALFFAYYVKSNGLENIDYAVGECLYMLLLRWLAYGLPVVLTYVSLTFAVAFWSKRALAGILLPTVYSMTNIFFSGFLHTSFYGKYIHPLPDAVMQYMYFFKTRALEEAIVYTPAEDFWLSASLVLSLCTVLFLVGWFGLLRMKE